MDALSSCLLMNPPDSISSAFGFGSSSVTAVKRTTCSLSVSSHAPTFSISLSAALIESSSLEFSLCRLLVSLTRINVPCSRRVELQGCLSLDAERFCTYMSPFVLNTKMWAARCLSPFCGSPPVWLCRPLGRGNPQSLVFRYQLSASVAFSPLHVSSLVRHRLARTIAQRRNALESSSIQYL